LESLISWVNPTEENLSFFSTCWNSFYWLVKMDQHFKLSTTLWLFQKVSKFCFQVRVTQNLCVSWILCTLCSLSKICYPIFLKIKLIAKVLLRLFFIGLGDSLANAEPLKLKSSYFSTSYSCNQFIFRVIFLFWSWILFLLAVRTLSHC